MSSKQSILYHSVTFGDKNTWDDWHLVPTTRPVFNPPEVKTNYLEVPGADSALDISQSLTGYPIYQNREGSMEFIVMNGYHKWINTYTEIMNYLHGRNMRAVLDDDPNYYYEGKFSVNQWDSDKSFSKITIDYNVGPYKWGDSSLNAEWLWDPFNFETDVVAYSLFGNIHLNSPSSWRLFSYEASYLGTSPICPTFIVRSSNNAGIDARMVNHAIGLTSPQVHIPEGTTTIYDFVFGCGGAVSLYMKGSATVSIDFRRGRL